MRDRLIELCGNVIESCKSTVCADCEHNNIDYPNCMSVHFADYLLANGVIVPPCKVGDKVYVIYNNKVIKGKTIAFDIVMEKDDVSFVAGVRFFCGISMNKGFAFGTNMFLTREEAEAKLKGGGQE